MKPMEFATLGIRLVGVGSIAFGFVLALSGVVMHGIFQLPLAGLSATDIHLDDTYYIVSSVHYGWLIPSGAGIAVGVVLIFSSAES
jgi:hypothetical protein